MEHGKSRTVSEAGFTFVEVIIALALLAAAASILMGMQGAAIQRTIRDRNMQQAMLAARRVLSMVEANQNRFNLSPQEGVTVAELLRNIGAPQSRNEREQRIHEQLQASIAIENWTIPLPNTDANPMRRIDLRIYWGPEPENTFSVTFFTPAPEEEGE